MLKEAVPEYIQDIQGQVALPALHRLIMATCCYYFFIVGLLILIAPHILIRVIPQAWPIHATLTRLSEIVSQYQQVLVACVFVSNLLSTQLLQTGAFEVSFNDDLVWSKLDTGTLPSAAQLIQRLQTYERSH